MDVPTPPRGARASTGWVRFVFLTAVTIPTASCGSANFYDDAYRPTYTAEEREAIKAAVADGTQAIHDAATPPAAVRDNAPTPRASGRTEPPVAAPPAVDATRSPAGHPPAPAANEPLRRTPSDPAPARGPARIMVYRTHTSRDAVNVYIDDLVQGGLIRSLDPGQQCGASGAITVTVRPGYHTLHAKAVGSSVTWGPVTTEVREGECYVWPLEGSNASAPGGDTRRGDAGAQVVRVAIWTRRSLNIEGLDVFLDGRPIVPASWSFSSNPDDCGRLPTYAVREYRAGDHALIEVRASARLDVRTPVVGSDRITVPSLSCYLYEIW